MSARRGPAKSPWRRSVGALAFAALVMGACASESPPSKGNIGVVFPSTAAAVAIDAVQFFVFEAPASSAARATYCQDLIQSRKNRDTQSPSTQSDPIGICDLLDGRVPVTVPYGDHAVMAVGIRGSKDFLIGCIIQTFGEGDAAVPVTLALVDASATLPAKTCPTIAEFCSGACKAD